VVAAAQIHARQGGERRLTEYRTFRLPENLCAEAEKWMTGRFDDLEALLSFLLQEIVRADGTKLDQEEEELVKQRLRELGYI